MYNFLLILIAAILGTLAHLSKKKDWLGWFLRIVIFITGLFELIWLAISSLGNYLERNYVGYSLNSLETTILTILCLATWLLLFMPIKELASWLFTVMDLIITGQIFVPLIRKKVKATEYFLRKKIFIPGSFPHLMALFIYVTTVAYLLISVNDATAFGVFCEPLPIPRALAQFLSFNNVGLILLSFCGVGIYVCRSGKEAWRRLGLVKPSRIQIGIGIFLIFASLSYDALWAIYTHHLAGQDLATELSGYNGSMFTMVGAFIPSVILALMITLCTGISEEILIRGALQPVFGILPSALLQGLLHAQIAHVPVFIVKITIWSIFMGWVRRYTNTTTTIIAHAGLNLISVLLFAANP